MKIEAITTCHAAGWEQYGRRMATTWTQLWPVPLTVWTEGFSCDVLGVQERDLTAIEWLTAFKKRHPYKHPGRYNYKVDAARFAHKVAAVVEHSLSADADWLIWCDADTVTHAPVPLSFVEALLPLADEYIAWLDREGSYPECGFYVLNLKHPQHRALMEAWRQMYVGGGIFRLQQWHDCTSLQMLVERVFKVPARSLSGEHRRTTHPFVNSRLGAYMDHMKGKRKTEGRSRALDLKVPRTEPYWRAST